MSEDPAERAVQAVIRRFPDWSPTPPMLGFARAVAIEALRPAPAEESGSQPAGLDWESIAKARAEALKDLGVRYSLYSLAIRNAVDILANRGRFGSPDDALERLRGALSATTPAAPNTFEVGKPAPYFCPACQAVPRAGYCKLAGCPTAPAEARSEQAEGEA